MEIVYFLTIPLAVHSATISGLMFQDRATKDKLKICAAGVSDSIFQDRVMKDIFCSLNGCNEINHAARVLSRYRDARRTRILRIRLWLTVRVISDSRACTPGNFVTEMLMNFTRCYARSCGVCMQMPLSVHGATKK